jgi:hypothetical protein
VRSNPPSKLIIRIAECSDMVAVIERGFISARTREGLRARQAKLKG